MGKLTNADLKKLAQLSFQKGEVNGTIASFVLEKLTNAQLKVYTKYLKGEIAQNTVYIESTDTNAELQKVLKDYFEDQTVEFTENKTLGAGLKIRQNDTIIDLTLKNMIENTVKTVKSEL